MTPADPSGLLARLADRYWQEWLAANPLFATSIGDRRFDHLSTMRLPRAWRGADGSFHDAVVGSGALPLTTLGDVVAAHVHSAT